jgi:hypothetical protein
MQEQSIDDHRTAKTNKKSNSKNEGLHERPTKREASYDAEKSECSCIEGVGREHDARCVTVPFIPGEDNGMEENASKKSNDVNRILNSWIRHINCSEEKRLPEVTIL